MKWILFYIELTLFCKAVFLLCVPQHILVHGVVPPQEQKICTSSCWSSWASCWTFSPACCGSTGWQNDLLACQPLPPVVFSANWLRLRSTPSSRSLMKMLRRTRPNIQGRCTLTATGLQLDSVSRITTLWVQHSLFKTSLL